MNYSIYECIKTFYISKQLLKKKKQLAETDNFLPFKNNCSDNDNKIFEFNTINIYDTKVRCQTMFV